MKINTIFLDNLRPRKFAAAESSVVWNTPLTFERGKVYLVKSPSGSGKTTLLHYLYGVRRDYSGEILFNSSPLEGFTYKQWSTLRQLSLSMVFQDLALLEDYTGRENLLIKTRLAFSNPSDEVHKAAGELGILHLMEKKVRAMSFGERQRVAIARALLQPFDWILLDEVFSHLDNANAALFADAIMRQCKKYGAGLIATYHHDNDYFDYDWTGEL